MKSLRAPSLADLLLFSLLLRLYFFYVTRDQVVWWDEAEYLLLGREIAGIGTQGVGQSWRPIGLPLLLAGFFAVGLGETAIRLALVATSLAAVWLTYRIGERIVGPTAAWIGAGLFSLCYLQLFYTFRILTETPHLAMSLFGVFLYLDGGVRRRWLCVPVLIAAACIRITDLSLLGLVAAHWWMSELFERPRAVRRRLAIGALVALAATAAAAWALRAELLSLWQAWDHMVPTKSLGERWERFVEHLQWLLQTLGPVQIPLLVFGLAWWAGGMRGHWRRHGTIGARLFLLAWVAVAFLPYAIFVKLHDRYLILALPPIFLAVGHGAVQIATRIGQARPALAAVALTALVAAAAVPMFVAANDLIHARTQTYADVAAAARWLRGRTQPGDRILANSTPQIAYYAERDVERLPDSAEELWEATADGHVRYLMVSTKESFPTWLRGVDLRLVGLHEAVRHPQTEPSVLIFTIDTG